MDMAAKVVLNPTDANILQSYKEDMGLSDDEDALKNAQSYFRPYLEAARCFYSGLDENLKSQFKVKAPQELCTKFQGKSCTVEALLESLKIGHEEIERAIYQQDAQFMDKLTWLQEKIRTSNLEWRRQFVSSITGNKSLAPGVKIAIRKGWRDSYIFEVHTCFNSLDLPKMEMEKETFLQNLNYAIEATGYNTA